MKPQKKRPQPAKPASKYTKILLDQCIDEMQPGTIVKDFTCLVQFVQESLPFKVTGKNQLIPLNRLADINRLLTHPIRLDLKRPQQKSYPNILALYWLLRATGLLLIEGSGNKHHAVLDDSLLQTWNRLNPTEQYCGLLETWLFRAKPEIIGERGGGFLDSPLYLWETLFARIPPQGLHVNRDKEMARMLRYFPGHSNLSLFKMFGYIDIQDGMPEKGKGWRILSITKTPLGEAMLTVLTERQRLSEPVTYEDILTLVQHEKELTRTIGILQPALQPYFPEWHQHLEIASPEPHEGIYCFKVSVGSPWCRIRIPGTMTWDVLAGTILDAFDFDYDHLYEFLYTDRFGIQCGIYHPALEEYPFTDETAIQEVPLRLGMNLIFHYDFGDSWKFKVLLEEIGPPNPTQKSPKIVETHGKAPEQYPEW